MNKDNESSSQIQMLDPGGGFVKKSKRIMLIVGLLNVIIDPLFLYITDPKSSKCFSDDTQAVVFYTISRTLLDVFYLLRIIFKFRIALEGTGPKVFKGRNLIKDPRLVAITYLKSWFSVHLFVVFPFPQMIIWSQSSTQASALLSVIVMVQFSLRMITVIPSDSTIIKTIGMAVKNVWSGAIYNLLIFILIGHFIGAIYYQVYAAMLQICMSEDSDERMNATYPVELNCSQVHKACITRYNTIEFGMLSDAFENEIGARNFVPKVIYCFVWGVRALSSLGQTFDPSYDVLETIFSCLIMISGLNLLADLIARMQTSVQSLGARRERQRVKQRRLEEWTRYNDLPPDLVGRIRQTAQSQWQCTQGIDDEAILGSLPSDLRCDIRNHLYKERVRNIPPFARLDEELLDFICGHLRTVVGTEGTYIVLQGDPVEQMVFIFSGLLQLSHRSGGGRSNSRSLEAGDFFGEELLAWASQSNASSQDLPPSTCSVKCLSNVEAFCLPAKDVRILAVFSYTQRFHLALRHHLA